MAKRIVHALRERSNDRPRRAAIAAKFLLLVRTHSGTRPAAIAVTKMKSSILFPVPPGSPPRGARRFRLYLLAGMVLLSVGVNRLSAAAFVVTKTADTNGSCNSGVNCSLREAINASNAISGSNTITFGVGVTGTIGLTSALPNINRDLTIQGPGANLLEITRSSGVFTIFEIATFNVSISGIAITNGHAANEHNPDVTHSGGGVDILLSSTVHLTNCILSGNTGDGGGGAIYNNIGTLVVVNCLISNNSSGAAGGGIENVNGTVTVTNSTFSGNTAATDGGGIINGNPSFNSAFGGTLAVNGSTFDSNNAARGAGIFNFANTLNIQNSTVVSNTASNSGGGIENLSNANNHQALATFSSCSISGNSASAGGGIYNDSSNTGFAVSTLQNTILESTFSQPGANLVNVNGPATRIVSNGYNLCSDNGGGFLVSTGDQINTDPLLGALQNNGGPTQTMLLQSNSPARDKGKSFGLTTDQRGSQRPIDDPNISPAPGGDNSDIGAVEMDSSQSAFTLTVTTTDDHNDGTCSIADCTLREAINAANSISGLNIIVFANGLSGTISLQAGLGTLVVTDTVQILGPGARVLAVSGQENIRVLNINSGVTVIQGLTIRDGWLAGFSGDGVSRQAGGIYNQATLSLSNCAFDNNFVEGANNLSNGGNGGAGQGGAIYNNGSLTLTGCTFSASGPSANPNTVGGGGGASNSGSVTHGGNGGVGQGGAIFNNTSANLSMVNCTFANNGAVGGGGGQDLSFAGGNGADGAGGAICNLGTLNILSCTFSANVGVGGTGGQGNAPVNNGSPGLGTGGIANVSGTTTIDDTICAANTGNHGGGIDVFGAFSSGGHNLIGSADHSTGFNGTDQVGTDASPKNPLLQALGNYGGDTNTFALSSTSTAINAGDGSAPSRDQRGYSRAGASDIGAFEFNGALTPSRVFSRKNHAGTDFDLDFPLTGPTVGVECRRNTGADTSGGNVGHDHQVLVVFPFAVGVTSATADHSVTVDALPTGFNQTYTLNLHNVPNAVLVTLTLNNVHDNTNGFTDTIPMGVLLADVDASHRVDSGDVFQIRTVTFQTLINSNFQNDVDLSGRIDSGDVFISRQQTLTGFQPSFSPAKGR
jgi:CSLREA domain-containing protein